MSAAGALAAVEAALFTYSTVGPRLDRRGQPVASAAFTALRAQRDVLRRWIEDSGATPTPPPPAYDLGPLPDPQAARAAALRAEEALAAQLVVLVQSSQQAQRTSAVGWLMASAVRAVTWRAALGVYPTTVAFPGLQTP